MAKRMQKAMKILAAALQRAPHKPDLSASQRTAHFPAPGSCLPAWLCAIPLWVAMRSNLLKLSYYTGPSEQELVPLRLEPAIRLESFSDFEMRQFISRDIRLLLSQKQDATIAKIYNAASTNAKSFMEQTIRDIDPSAVDKIRTGGQKQPELPH